LADRKAKGKVETLIEIDQKMVNQKDLSQMEIEVTSSEMIKENRGVLDVTKRVTSKETVWQKMSTCTIRKK